MEGQKRHVIKVQITTAELDSEGKVKKGTEDTDEITGFQDTSSETTCVPSAIFLTRKSSENILGNFYDTFMKDSTLGDENPLLGLMIDTEKVKEKGDEGDCPVLSGPDSFHSKFLISQHWDRIEANKVIGGVPVKPYILKCDNCKCKPPTGID